jgi:hypothetical protein
MNLRNARCNDKKNDLNSSDCTSLLRCNKVFAVSSKSNEVLKTLNKKYNSKTGSMTALEVPLPIFARRGRNQIGQLWLYLRELDFVIIRVCCNNRLNCIHTGVGLLLVNASFAREVFPLHNGSWMFRRTEAVMTAIFMTVDSSWRQNARTVLVRPVEP